MSRRIMSTNDVAEVLATIEGVTVTVKDVDAHHGYILADTEHARLYFRERNQVRIGASRTFDRWANSTDWVTRWPLDDKDVRAIVFTANNQAQKKPTNDWSIGDSEDVTCLLRNAKHHS
jgi:hypothetical protein